MSTATAPPQSPPSPASSPKIEPRNDVVLLHGLTWTQYRGYRDDVANEHLRMHYSAGDLLLMTTGDLHERLSQLIGLYITAWARANSVPLMSYGRWTMLAEAAEKGLEADNCFYIREIPDVRGQRRLDLSRDTAPHLAIEIDITTNSELKFDIYRSLGVQEVWVWDAAAFLVYRLEGHGYTTAESSQLLEEFPFDRAAELIVSMYQAEDGAVLEAFLKDVEITGS